MALPYRASADELANMRFSRGHLWVFFLAIVLSAVASACALGDPQEPGCLTDVECGNDRVCRGGACFRIVGDVDAAVIEDDAG